MVGLRTLVLVVVLRTLVLVVGLRTPVLVVVLCSKCSRPVVGLLLALGCISAQCGGGRASSWFFYSMRSIWYNNTKI